MEDPRSPASELPPSPATTVIGDDPSQLVGTVIGPYKLIEQIGEGGFGLVFVAEQQKPVKRRVALKVIKPGMDTHDVINRFEAERQALALMDHPNIARVLDAGATATGRPYFVMELVHGIPITNYCDKNRLTLRERLELFVSVCQAVQHAHQKGIIHRDIKPSNVLVTAHDRRPLVKVIDFGVAKALHQPLTEKTIYTRFAQMVGTPLYMSPEQAEMTGLDIDTRSDIYSLGVLLYELLTGTTPFDRKRLSQVAYDELIRIIRDEEPSRPSTRLSRSTETLSAVAAQRRTEPARLSRMFRGDLDWITMKALEKDRTRRYETANGLARDIERYLREEPVEAGPPGAGYRLRKLARKHRTVLGIAALFVAFLLLAVCVSTWQAVRATRAEREAVAERDRAEASFKMARDTVDRFFTQVAESPKLKARGMEGFRKSVLANAKDFYERFIEEQPDAVEIREDLGLAHIRLAKIHDVLGEYATAQALSEKAIELLGELARVHPEVANYQRDLAASQFELGSVYFHTGNLDKEAAAYQKALAIQVKLSNDHPEVADYRRALATTLDALGYLDFRARRLEGAQSSLEQALVTWCVLASDSSHLPEDRYGLARVQQRLGATYGRRGQTEKSEARLKEAASTYQALVRDYPDVPEYRHSLASTYTEMGALYINNTRQLQNADAAHLKALQILEKLAEEHPDVLEFNYDVGHCYFELAVDERLLGRSDAALASFDKAIRILEHVVSRGYGRARTDFLNARIGHASVLTVRGAHAQAIDEVTEVGRQDGLSAGNLYNIGCVFALSSATAGNDTKLSGADRTRLKSQYADRAMEFLHEAVAKGFQNAAELKSDPDVAPLRSREDFEKLLREVKRKSKN
jgi:eukaryotic-like serine/threonine-protein kinase